MLRLISISQRRFATTCQYTCLTNRYLYSIQGPDAFKLLQGLVTNQMTLLGEPKDSASNMIYAAFLSPTGRILFDSFLYRFDTIEPYNYILDIDVRLESAFTTHMKRYILRSKIEMKKLSDKQVWQAWGLEEEMSGLEVESGSLLFKDPRHHSLGYRFIQPKNNIRTFCLIKQILLAFTMVHST